MEDKTVLKRARNLFVKLKNDPANLLFSEELLDKRLLKQLKKSKYEKDTELLKLKDLGNGKDFLDNDKVPRRID